MGRKAISKKTRQKVYEKYNGHCAYCGCEISIGEMQVDHINSVFIAEYNGREVNECLDNYNPACRQCNFYKSTYDIETFRNNLSGMMMRNLEKNFNYRMAKKYGLVKESIKPITFYFEKVERNGDCETCKHYGDEMYCRDCYSRYGEDPSCYEPYIP